MNRAYCNRNHGGNHKLYKAGAFYECAGCGCFFTADQVECAKPEPYFGSGGVTTRPWGSSDEFWAELDEGEAK